MRAVNTTAAAASIDTMQHLDAVLAVQRGLAAQEQINGRQERRIFCAPEGPEIMVAGLVR